MVPKRKKRRRPYTPFENDLAKEKYPREWAALRNAIARCDDKDDEDYGKREVRVCRRWRREDDGFILFLEDMGLKTCPPGRVLGRIDLDGHYEPGNCEWSTMSKQMLRRHAKERRLRGEASE